MIPYSGVFNRNYNAVWYFTDTYFVNGAVKFIQVNFSLPQIDEAAYTVEVFQLTVQGDNMN